ncbi:MAG: nucleotide exchange factor GrpE, partial [Rhodobacterales bacterium]|nr:nucleotide exchange factor GrpE [Rhodobacterales bacterium]
TKLSDMGMEEIPGVGAVFNPKLHEALGQTPVFEADQDGKILAVITDGFSVNGKVLQAAQVLVGKYTEPAGEA